MDHPADPWQRGVTRMGENSDGTPKKRKPRGRPFKKGRSANPKGRPKKDFDLVTRCRELTPPIIEHYAAMGARARTAAEVAAGRVVVEYGYDKPRQRVEATGPNGSPLGGPTVVLCLPDDGSGPDDPGAKSSG